MRADVVRRHAHDLDDFTFPEGRDDLHSQALRPEGKTDFVFQVVIPAQGLLFRSSIDDSFVVDSVFADRVFADFSLLRPQNAAHGSAPNLEPASDLRLTDASAIEFPDLGGVRDRRLPAAPDVARSAAPGPGQPEFVPAESLFQTQRIWPTASHCPTGWRGEI